MARVRPGGSTARSAAGEGARHDRIHPLPPGHSSVTRSAPPSTGCCAAARWRRGRRSRSSSGSSRRTSRSAGPVSRSARAPRVCTWGCWPAASGRVTRSSSPSFTFAAHRQRGRPRRSDAGVRRHLAAWTSASMPRPSRRRSPSGPSASCRCTCTGTPPTCRPCRRWPTVTVCRSSRTPPRRTGPRCTAYRSGAFGTFGMFSLYPTKNMTSGEGGMVAVGDPEVERLMRVYRNQGMERRYENEVVGLNARMTDIHAAIGRVQLTQGGGLDPATPGQRGPAGRRAPRGHRADRRRGGRARLPPVHRAGARGPGRVRRGAGAGAPDRLRRLLPGARAPAGAVPHGRRGRRPARDRPRGP